MSPLLMQVSGLFADARVSASEVEKDKGAKNMEPKSLVLFGSAHTTLVGVPCIRIPTLKLRRMESRKLRRMSAEGIGEGLRPRLTRRRQRTGSRAGLWASPELTSAQCGAAAPQRRNATMVGSRIPVAEHVSTCNNC